MWDNGYAMIMEMDRYNTDTFLRLNLLCVVILDFMLARVNACGAILLFRSANVPVQSRALS